MVETEVKLNQLGLAKYSDIDKHSVIDVCGVSLKYFPQGKKPALLEDLEGADPESLEYGCNVLRGIEVKVSRGDFKNGFICSGCNYHHILIPMRLLTAPEVPKGVGLIEFNKYKFSCELNRDDSDATLKRTFNLKGLTVVKRPMFRNIPQFQIDHATSLMARRKRKADLKKVSEEIEETIRNRVLVYIPNRYEADI